MSFILTTAGIAESSGKYFIAQRKPGCSIPYKWEFPGGKVKGGEEPEEALSREYFEEFNLKIRVLEKFCSLFFKNGEKKYKLLVFRIEILPGTVILKEHSRFAWKGIGELENVDFSDSDSLILSELLKTRDYLNRRD